MPFLKVNSEWSIVNRIKDSIHNSQFTIHWRRRRHGLPSEALAKDGQILMIVLLFLFVISLLSLSIFARVGNFVRFGARSASTDTATAVADAGIDYAAWQLTQNSSWSPSTSGPPTCSGIIQLGASGDFRVSVDPSPNPDGSKNITVNSYTPRCSNTSTNRQVKATLVSTPDKTYSFTYAAQSVDNIGNGNDITLGDVGGGSTITGSARSNRNISASGVTSTITQDAYANGTISNNPPLNVQGTRNSGAAKINPPIPNSDITTWSNEADINGNLTCPPSGNITGTVTINGGLYNCSINIAGNNQLYIKGALHITGSLTIDAGGAGSAGLFIDDALQPNGTFVIVDQLVTVTNGGKVTKPLGSTARGLLAVVSNQETRVASGSNKAVFYAYGSNTANICGGSAAGSITGAVIGNIVNMSGGGYCNSGGGSNSITFDSNLASEGFSYRASQVPWGVKRGTYKIVK